MHILMHRHRHTYKDTKRSSTKGKAVGKLTKPRAISWSPAHGVCVRSCARENGDRSNGEVVGSGTTEESRLLSGKPTGLADPPPPTPHPRRK